MRVTDSDDARSLEAAEAAHDYAVELFLHQHFLHAHMRMSQKPIDDTHTFLETYGDSIGQVLHKMNALLTDLEVRRLCAARSCTSSPMLQLHGWRLGVTSLLPVVGF